MNRWLDVDADNAVPVTFSNSIVLLRGILYPLPLNTNVFTSHLRAR